jgi:methionyl-tRNA formyltransferase
MTDLPFGRGGSPLQNLIARGIYKTKVSALKCSKELDAGPIYLKKDLLLRGSAHEILEKCSKVIFSMIQEIIIQKPEPKEQTGEVTVFKRRTPAESNLESLEDMIKIYDYIRMLDAEGYPPAFLETSSFIF